MEFQRHKMEFQRHKMKFRRHKMEFRLAQASFRFRKMEFRPRKMDSRLAQTSFRFRKMEFRPRKMEFRLAQASLRLQKMEFRLSGTANRRQNADGEPFQEAYRDDGRSLAGPPSCSTNANPAGPLYAGLAMTDFLIEGDFAFARRRLAVSSTPSEMMISISRFRRGLSVQRRG